MAILQSEAPEAHELQSAFEALDARLASFVFYGALEEILTGWVLGQLPDDDEQVALAESTIVDVICGGFAGVPAGAAA